MSRKIEEFKMKTKFEGIIKLFADVFYSVPDVFVRELVQNCHDSIVRRRSKERSLAGRIDITINSKDKTLTFRDNGLGMNELDIKEFLAVIGATGTGLTREEFIHEDNQLSLELIGQFGIGMLSSFVVADRVYVKSLKIDSNTSFEWRNHGSEECELFEADKTSVGTDVIVYLREEHSYYLDVKKVESIVIKYCDFVPTPIFINGNGPINIVEAPWNKLYPNVDDEMQSYLSFVNRRFPDVALDVFPFSITGEYNAKGLMYISDRRLIGLNSTGCLDIYVRKMLVKEADYSLLPTWAKFIRGIIDSPDLQPTASRENIQISDPSFKYMQKELGQIIIDRLKFLAENEPLKFKQINEWHHDHIKGMACVNEEFFELVSELLLFNTNKDKLTISEYLSKNALVDNKAPIYYFSYDDAASQFYRLADAKGFTVINAGSNFDEELLKLYANKHNDVMLTQLDVKSAGVLFEPLELEESSKYKELEKSFTFALNRSGINVRVMVQRFEPKKIPALVIESERTQAEENLRRLLFNPTIRLSMADVWDDVVKEQREKPTELALNASNSLINILNGFDLDDGIVHDIMVALYNNTLLYSYQLDDRNKAIVHDSMVNMIENLVSAIQQRNDAQKSVAHLRNEMRDKMNNTESLQLPEHIRIFMITPFSEEYRTLVRCVRRVFESSPFFFEVVLANDFTYRGNRLIDNVKKHISNAHAFIAEISDLNPNVMLEIGSILMRQDDRPVFSLRSRDASKDVPVDINDRLYIPYGYKNDPPDELCSAIRSSIIDGKKIVNEDILDLISARNKCFLSVTILENMRLRLSEGQKDSLVKSYSYIEDLLADSDENIERRTKVEPHFIPALRGELKEMISDE